MPTINPRISLTLPPHRYDLITRLAALQGVSRAYLINDMLEEIYPVLERVCVVLEAAKQSQESVKNGLRDAVQQAEDEPAPLAHSVLGQFDLFMERVQTVVTPGVASGMGGGTCAAGPLFPCRRVRPGSHPNGTFPEGQPRVVTRGQGLPDVPLRNLVQIAAIPSSARDSCHEMGLF